MTECKEHQFPEEVTPEGVRLLFPCLNCGLAAADAMKATEAERDALQARLDVYTSFRADVCHIAGLDTGEDIDAILDAIRVVMQRGDTLAEADFTAAGKVANAKPRGFSRWNG